MSYQQASLKYPDQTYTFAAGGKCNIHCENYRVGICALTGKHMYAEFGQTCTIFHLDIQHEAYRNFPLYVEAAETTGGEDSNKDVRNLLTQLVAAVAELRLAVERLGK